MTVDTDRNRQCRLGSDDGFGDLFRQASAVCVAEADKFRAGILGCLDRLQGEVAIGSQAVEEVLGVVDDLTTFAGQKADRVADHRKVLFLVDTQHFGDVQVPGLADDRANGSFRVPQGEHPDVLVSSNALAASHAEGRDLRVLPVGVGSSLKELLVLRVRQRIAAFDVVKAEVVEHLRDEQLVLQRKVDAFALAAVSECGVVNLDASHGG